MSELREILEEFFNGGYQEFLQGIKIEYFLEKTIKQIKQHYLVLLPKEMNESDLSQDEFQTICDGDTYRKIVVGWHNDVIAEIRKKIEED